MGQLRRPAGTCHCRRPADGRLYRPILNAMIDKNLLAITQSASYAEAAQTRISVDRGSRPRPLSSAPGGGKNRLTYARQSHMKQDFHSEQRINSFYKNYAFASRLWFPAFLGWDNSGTMGNIVSIPNPDRASDPNAV
jgi:hypothetical protein